MRRRTRKPATLPTWNRSCIGSPTTPGPIWRWPRPTCDGSTGCKKRRRTRCRWRTCGTPPIRSRFPSRQALDAWFGRVTGDRRELSDAGMATCPAGRGNFARCKARVTSAWRGSVSWSGRKAFRGPHTSNRRCGSAPSTAKCSTPRPPRPGWRVTRPHGSTFCIGRFVADDASKRRSSATCCGTAPPAGVPAMIEFIVNEFQPGPEILCLMQQEALKRVGPESLTAFRTSYASRLEARAKSLEGAPAAAAWLDAGELHGALQQAPQAIACARAGGAMRPGQFRRTLSTRFGTPATRTVCRGGVEPSLVRRAGRTGRTSNNASAKP